MLRQIIKFIKWNLISILIIAALLIGLRIALPHVVKWYVNKTLDEIPEYDGQIGDVDMKLWRGAYEIEDIHIIKTTGKVPVPFFSSSRVELSVEWKALFEGALVAEIKFDNPTINFVKGTSKENSQVGVDQPWLGAIDKLFPLDINRFEVNNGSVHYRDFYSEPKVDLEIDRIHAVGKNFTNSRKLSNTLVAHVDMTGRAFKENQLEIRSDINPFTQKPTFNLDVKLNPVPLTRFNDFARAYGKFDFEKGTLAVALELAAVNGTAKGYLKPLFDNMAIVNLEKDAQNPLQLVWESIVAGVSRVFRNLPENRLATKIPVSGELSDPKIGVLPALGNILKNAFIQAFQGNIENIIDLESVQEENETKNKN